MSSSSLLPSQKSSQLQAVLHPLVLLTISDYITRHTLRGQSGPIVGALLGQQNGREITIEHAFECHTQTADVEGGYLLEAAKFGSRLEQMVQVHKERQLELVGWYTLLPSSGPTPTVIPIHSQILECWNESAVLLGFHPDEALHHPAGGKLPVTIYESNYEVDGPRADQQDEDRNMDDAEPALKLRFREVPYSVEADETEMISMNYVAAAAAAPPPPPPPPTTTPTKEERSVRSVESTSKGKRRLVESDVDEARGPTPDDDDADGAGALTREEEETLASLTTRANAIKMLHSRIRLLVAYLERLPASFVAGELTGGQTADADSMDTDNTVPSLPILRQIQALVSRLGLVIPSDKEAYDMEMLRESNDVNLIGLLNDMMQGVSEVRQVNRKLHVIEAAKAQTARRSSGPDYQGSSSFSLPGAGELLI